MKPMLIISSLVILTLAAVVFTLAQQQQRSENNQPSNNNNNNTNCNDNTPMLFCLMPLMDASVLSRLKDFQSITPLVLVSDTPQQFQSRLDVANALCRNLLSSKLCAGANRTPVAWWECPVLLAKGTELLLSVKQYFQAPGMTDDQINSDRIQLILRLADELCTSPTGLRALTRNQQCLTSALNKTELRWSIATMNRIFTGPVWNPDDCDTAQLSTDAIVRSINQTCWANRNETYQLTGGVFVGSMKLLGGYNANECPLLPTSSASTRVSSSNLPSSSTSTQTSTPDWRILMSRGPTILLPSSTLSSSPSSNLPPLVLPALAPSTNGTGLNNSVVAAPTSRPPSAAPVTITITIATTAAKITTSTKTTLNPPTLNPESDLYVDNCHWITGRGLVCA